MEAKVVSAILESKCFSVKAIVDETDLSQSEVEDVLISLGDRGYLAVNSGGSMDVAGFEVISNLEELL